MNGLPEAWAAAAERAGVRGSARGISQAAGLSHVTVSRLINEGRTSPETIAAVAKALRITEAEVYEMANVPVSELGPWSPPMEAHLMSPRLRAAVTELILAAVEQQQDMEGSGGHADSAAPMNDAGKTPASIADYRCDRGDAHQALAARRGTSQRGKVTHAQDLAGEGSQDQGGHE